MLSSDKNVETIAQLIEVLKHYLELEGEYASSRWSRKCYLMGLQSADESNNPNVAQTIGWTSTFGGAGRFDPLSLTPDNSSNKNVNTGN